MSVQSYVHIPTSSPAAKEKVLEQLIIISKHAGTDAKLCRRYVVAVPRDESKALSLYVLGEFIGMDGVQEHCILPQAQKLAKLFEANPDWFGGEPEITWNDVDSLFVRPSLLTATSDPFIAAATIEYKRGKRAEALEGWRKVTQETQKNEPDALAYSVVTAQEDADVARIVEFYPSEDYFRNVHAKSPYVLENREKYGEEHREDFKFELLKMVAGFLYNEPGELVEEYS